MKTPVATVLAAALAAALLAPAPAAAAGGAKPKVTVSRAKTLRGDGPDDNVQRLRAPNDPAAPAARPPPAGKRGVCTVRILNDTPWAVDVYLDGNFKVTVAGYTEARALALPGATRFYGRAEFQGQGGKAWGPEDWQCPARDTYTWRLQD